MGWVTKGNVRGPQGIQGPQGPQGLAGVNGVANDAATASYINGPSATKTAIETNYAGMGIPAAVSAMTRPGKVQKNAVKVLRPLWALLAGRDANVVNIVIPTDSLGPGVGASTHEKRWISQLASNLRTRFPTPGKTGGRGYITAANTAPTSFTWPVVLAGGATFANDDYGASRAVASLPTGGTATYSLVGTSADIIFVKAAGFGSFSWKVDGGSATTVSSNAAVTAGGSKIRVPLGAAGAHTLVLTGVSGSNYVCAASEINGTELGGIMVHDCGHSGFTSGDWIASPFDPAANWPAAIAALNPSILLIPLGINDVNDSIAPATFQANLTSMVAKMRAASGMTNTAVVFVAMYAMGGKLAAWQNYVDAMYAAAEADGNALVADLTTRLWNYDDPGRGAVFVDTAHPNDIGHAMIAQGLTEFLSPS